MPSTVNHTAMPKDSPCLHSQAKSYASLGLAGLLLLSALMTGLPDEMQQSLRLYTDHRFSSHYWGAISGHLLHYSWPHYALNVTGVLLWTSLFGHLKGWLYWLGITVFIMLFIDAGVFIKGGFTWYVGFSGVLHGLLAHGALIGTGIRNPLNRALLIAIIAKVSAESLGLLPDLSSSMTQIDTAYETHAYGLLGGVLAWLIVSTGSRLKALPQ
jgi:rhomboid family GlyGly-CTERM serine protease